MAMRIVLLFALVLPGVTFGQGVVCKTDSDCAANQCCYIKPEFEIVSRRDQRQAVLPVLPGHTHHDTGVCETYRREHDHCSPLETANGHCGCSSGMSCQFVPDPTATAGPAVIQPQAAQEVSRRKIFFPGPGAYQCEQTQS